MFDISIFLNWPSNRWRILAASSGLLSTNGAWEVNLYATHSWVLLDTHLHTSGAHRGFFLMMGVLGYAVDVNVYDRRHDIE